MGSARRGKGRARSRGVSATERDPSWCWLAGCTNVGTRTIDEAIAGCRELTPNGVHRWKGHRICEAHFNDMRIGELEAALEDSRREAQIAWATVNKTRGALVVVQQELIDTQKRLIA